MKLLARLNGSWVLLRASFHYLLWPVEVERRLLRALRLREYAREYGTKREREGVR